MTLIVSARTKEGYSVAADTLTVVIRDGNFIRSYSSVQKIFTFDLDKKYLVATCGLAGLGNVSSKDIIKNIENTINDNSHFKVGLHRPLHETSIDTAVHYISTYLRYTIAQNNIEMNPDHSLTYIIFGFNKNNNLGSYYCEINMNSVNVMEREGELSMQPRWDGTQQVLNRIIFGSSTNKDAIFNKYKNYMTHDDVKTYISGDVISLCDQNMMLTDALLMCRDLVKISSRIMYHAQGVPTIGEHVDLATFDIFGNIEFHAKRKEDLFDSRIDIY